MSNSLSVGRRVDVNEAVMWMKNADNRTCCYAKMDQSLAPGLDSTAVDLKLDSDSTLMDSTDAGLVTSSEEGMRQLYVFTARRYSSVVYAVIVCLSVHVSVTSRHCSKDG